MTCQNYFRETLVQLTPFFKTKTYLLFLLPCLHFWRVLFTTFIKQIRKTFGMLAQAQYFRFSLNDSISRFDFLSFQNLSRKAL